MLLLLFSWTLTTLFFLMANAEDPFAFIFDLARISPSQEQLVKDSPFVRGDMPSPDTQDAPTLTDVNADALEVIHLEKDSQLGFSEVQAECSLAAGGDLGKIEGGTGLQPKKVKEDLLKGKGLAGEGFSEVQGECTLAAGGDLGKIEGGAVVESEKEGTSKGKRKLVSDEGCDSSGTKESHEGSSSGKVNVFDALRALSNIRDGEHDFLSALGLLDVARICNITFPRPRWHPLNYNPYQSVESPKWNPPNYNPCKE